MVLSAQVPFKGCTLDTLSSESEILCSAELTDLVNESLEASVNSYTNQLLMELVVNNYVLCTS